MYLPDDLESPHLECMLYLSCMLYSPYDTVTAAFISLFSPSVQRNLTRLDEAKPTLGTYNIHVVISIVHSKKNAHLDTK